MTLKSNSHGIKRNYHVLASNEFVDIDPQIRPSGKIP